MRGPREVWRDGRVVPGNQSRFAELISETVELWPFSFFCNSIQDSDSWENVPEKRGLDTVPALWTRLGNWIDSSCGKSGCSLLEEGNEVATNRNGPLLDHTVSLEKEMTSGFSVEEGRPVLLPICEACPKVQRLILGWFGMGVWRGWGVSDILTLPCEGSSWIWAQASESWVTLGLSYFSPKPKFPYSLGLSVPVCKMGQIIRGLFQGLNR